MADKLIYIANDDTQITSSVDYNLRLDTQYNELTIIIQSKLLIQRIMKCYNKTLGVQIERQTKWVK